MGFNINNFFDNLTSRLTGGLSSLSNNVNSLLGKSQAESSSEINKSEQTSWLAWLGKPSAKTPGFNAKSSDVLLRRLAADKVQLSDADINSQNTREAARYNLQQTPPQQQDRTGKNKTQQPPSPRPISAPSIDSAATEPPTRGHKPYSILIPLPAGKEKVSYEQLQRAVIRDVFSHHGIYTSRAAVEDFIATHGDVDLNEQVYRSQEGETVTTRNRVPGLMPEVGTFTDETTGKEVRGYRLTVTSEFQSFVLGERGKAEAITKAGTKVVPELSMNERMQKAMQIAYEKHLPHSVGAALREVDPKQLMVGVAVAGGVVAVASKAGAAKAIPLVGAGISLAQVASYLAEGEHLLKLCAAAKTEADLDKAAQQFAQIVKQGGIDVGLTLATAGIGKFGAVSRAGGQLIDDAMRIADDATRAALGKFAQWNDEIVTGIKQAFGENLAIENVPSRAATSAVEDLNVYSKSEDLEMLKGGAVSGRETITETANGGLTEISEAGMKRLKHEIPKEVMRQAKEQLVTLNVARTELIARLDELVKNGNLLSDTKKVLAGARNSLEYNLKQDDLVGALRDKFSQPVRVSGSGEAFDHLQEVRQGLNSLENAKKILMRELKNKPIGSDEYVRLSREIDAIKEMQRRVNTFLETK